MAKSTPEQRQFMATLRRLDEQLGRLRRQRLLVRAAWIGTLVLCIGLIAKGWLGWGVQTPLIWLIALVALALGVTYAMMPSSGSLALARAFDSAFQLDAELATALEVSASGQREGLAPLVIERARRHVALVEPEVLARTAEPLRLEIQTLALMLVLVAGVLLLGGLHATLPTAPAASLPTLQLPATAAPPELAGAEPSPEPAAATQPGDQPVGDQPGNEPTLSPEAQQAAAAIADALRDNGATRAAAAALDRGDPGQAAQELRELADQASDLSQASRNDLADALDGAAQELAPQQPALADRLRDEANQLRRSPEGAEQALDDLADALEQLGQAESEQPAGTQPGANPQAGEQAGQGGENGQQGSGDQPGNQPGAGGGGSSAGTGSRQAPPPAPAPNQEVPLPAPPASDGPTTPGGGNGETTINQPGGTGSGSGGPGGSGGSVPDDLNDPAAIPPELRDAIQDYFNGQPR